MANMISTISDSILPISPEPVLPAPNSGTGVGEAKTFAANPNEPLRSDTEMAVNAGKNGDNASDTAAAETSGESFQDVLERRISEESPPETSAKGDGTPKQKKDPEKTAEASEAAGSEENANDKADLVDPNAGQDPETVLVGDSKFVVDLAALKKTAENSDGKETKTPGQGTSPRKIVSVSSKPKSDSNQMESTELSAETDGDKSVAKAGETEFAKPALNANALEPETTDDKTQPQNNPETTDDKTQPQNNTVVATKGEKLAPSIKTMNPETNTNQAATSNKNTAEDPTTAAPDDANKQTATKLQNQLQTGEDVANKLNTTANNKGQPSVNENAKAAENMETDAGKLYVADETLSPEDTKTILTSEKLNDLVLPQSANETNTAQANTKSAPANKTSSNEQKTLDGVELEVSHTVRAQSDAVVDNAAYGKTATESVVAANKPNNVSQAVGNITGSRPASENAAAVITRTGMVDDTITIPGRQIIQHININPPGIDRQINITLNPAELGRVQINFQQTDGEITGVLQVEKAETMRDIERSLPEIVLTLQDNGIPIKRVDVTMQQRTDSDQQQKTTPDDFEGTSPQDFSGDQASTGSDQSHSTQASSDDNSYPQTTRTANEISDDRINVYV